MTKKKKIIFLVGMVLLIAVTAVCNILISDKIKKQDVAEGSKTQETGDFFEQYRTIRTTTRDELVLHLDSIINSQNIEEESKVEATNQKLEVAKNIELELTLESLLMAKGFDNVVVLTNVTSDNINVVVDKAELTAEDSALIYTTINGETGLNAACINIIPIE